MSAAPIQVILTAFGWQDRYELLEKIGAGAMGQVWRAREITTGRIVALKMLDPDRSGDVQTLARLEIEGATLTKLHAAGKHEHVVPILDFQITDSHACLVMEFIPGMNLRRWCESQRPSLADRVRLIAQVARAAGWFHGLGVIHRDLKPVNILVHAVTHQPVIVDFSIAKVEESLTLTLTNEALGTAPYMAPEQFSRARGEPSPALDVYSLGSTLYELLTRVHPHPGDLTQVVRRHAEEVRPAPPSALNPEVPRDLECICLKAISHRPGDRYADGIALAEDLDHFLAGEPVSARPISRLTRFARLVRRKPALSSAVAACLLLAQFAGWNLRRQLAQRERFTLQTRLTTAMQNATWDTEKLTEAEVMLGALVSYNAPLAAQVRQRLHDDIVKDIEVRLQRNHLRDEDYRWLSMMVGWLQPRVPDHAGRLQNLITERMGRWETLAELRPPFADRQGLFPRSNLQVERDLLYPIYNGPAEIPAPFNVTDSVMLPMEAACTLVADARSFQPITLIFNHDQSRVALWLYQVSQLPKSTLTSLRVEKPHPQSYALVLSHNSTNKRAIHIPDIHLLDHPFLMTLRVEREWAEASLNGKSQLRVDSPFALGSKQAANYWRIAWPKSIGLKELVLRHRRSDAVSPLERADLLAAQELWAEARRLYQDLRGDPLFSTEADYKTAECLLRQGDKKEAMAIWERLLQGPASRWRDRSLLQLWAQSALQQSRDSARYLAMLPDPLPPALRQQIDPTLLSSLVNAYGPIGMSIALPRVDITRVMEATKAFRLLHRPRVETANRFAMAHHFARLDQEARELFDEGLADPAACATLALNLLAGTSSLDQWCRIVPSEKEPMLAGRLEEWRSTLRKNPTVQAIWRMEQARWAARAGDLAAALVNVKAAHAQHQTDNRILVSARLLEGMLHRLQNHEDRAQASWGEALKVADTVTLKSPLFLCDCILLRSLTQSWNLRTAGDVLTTLAGRHLKNQERATFQAAFNQTFLTDPAWLTTFNNVFQGGRGRTLATDYALCLDPPRELAQRFYRLLFGHYFLTTAFPQPTAEQTTRVRQIVDLFVTEMAMNPKGEGAHFHAYLRAWNDRAAAQPLFDTSYPYSPALIKNMQWLLAQRHHLASPEDSARLIPGSE